MMFKNRFLYLFKIVLLASLHMGFSGCQSSGGEGVDEFLALPEGSGNDPAIGNTALEFNPTAGSFGDNAVGAPITLNITVTNVAVISVFLERMATRCFLI